MTLLKKIIQPLYLTLFLFTLSACQTTPTEATLNKNKIVAANPLPSGVWLWQGTFMSNGDEFKPQDSNRFQLIIDHTDKVSLLVDCNPGSARVDATEYKLTFEQVISTRAYCGPDSMDNQFLHNIQHVSRWLSKDDRLILELKMDSGIMIFEPNR